MVQQPARETCKIVCDFKYYPLRPGRAAETRIKDGKTVFCRDNPSRA
jgi:hypothetical protein